MRLPPVFRLALAFALAACAPAGRSPPIAARIQQAPAAPESIRDLEFAVHWTSLEHEPLGGLIVLELLAPDGRVVARCTPAPTPERSFGAACHTSGKAAEGATIAITLPLELGGLGHPRVILSFDGTARQIDVDMWIAMAAGERPLVDTIKLRYDRRPPPDLLMRRDWTPTPGALPIYTTGYTVFNDTRETLSIGDTWMETLPAHERWTCGMCGNVGRSPPLEPGGTRLVTLGPVLGGCAPTGGVNLQAVHRFVARFIGEPVPVAVPADRWPVRPPAVSMRPIYELADEFVFR